MPTEYYDRTTNFGYDIALICLKTEIQFSSIVLPACIDLDQMDYEIPEGTLGKVTRTTHFNTEFMQFPYRTFGVLKIIYIITALRMGTCQ